MKRKKLRAHSIESLESRRLFTVYTVTSVADTGAGTLRQAILDSNANTGSDTINFNLVGAANVPPPIKPAGNLPSITDALTIDGTSQPGYAGKPIVVLSGDLIPTSPIATYGLQVSASNVTIKGLDIVGFKGAGISIAAVSGVQVQGNYIGIDTDGVTAHGNVTGISANGYNNTIGGTTAAARNVISGNTTGIALTGRLNNGVAVQGNYIGTNAAGTAAVGNVTGVVFSITLGTIGGSAAAQNIISGNTGAGVNAADLSSTAGNNFATVSYNLIGVSASGAALGNGGAGVQSGAPVNAALNLYVTNNEIANNAGAGVLVQGNSLVHTLIENNSIHDNTGQGIDVSGAPNSTSIPPAPVIWGIAGSSYRAEIKVAAAASRTYTIDLYASNTAYPFTKGEGKTLVGSAVILTDSSGLSDTYVMITGPVSPGQVLTATLTDGSATTTSTFSNGVFLGNPSITAAVADVTGGGYALVSRTVYLDTNNNGVLDSGETSVQTSSTGSASFGSVGSGTYYVRTVLPAGAAQYYPADDAAFVVDAEPGTTNSVFFYTRSVGLTPNIGGPYSVAEGASITLDASKSTITTGTISKYEWDLNYDYTAFNVDATGATTTFSAANLDGPSTRTVALRLTDAQGDATIVTTKVNITNANPTATFKGDTAAFGTPSFVTFTGATDPAPADSTAGFKYSYDFNNDGDFADTGDVANSTSSIASFTYATAGSHTIHGRITDKDGGFTDYTTTVSVTAGAVPTSNPGGPYTVAEGQSITLNGSGSASGGATITKYDWDLDYDGTTFTADATGASPTFSAATLDGPSTRVVGVRVTDSNGQVSAVNKAVVTITNVAPTAQFSGGEEYTNQPSPVFFQFAVDSPADVSAGFNYSYDFNNDGDFVDAGDVANSTLASASYTFTTPGTYTVHGRITDKDGAFTDYTTTVTEIDQALPGAPYSITGSVQSGTGFVDLTWGLIEGADGVDIQRATNSSFTSATTLNTSAIKASYGEFIDESAVVGNTYYYRLRGKNNAGPGPWSTTAIVSTAAATAPSVPTNFAVTPNYGNMVTVSWTDTSSNETGFEVQRSASSTFSSPTVFTTGPNATSYVDTTTAINTYYYYRVRAVNGSLASAYTKSVKIKTPKTTGGTTTVLAPSNLKAVANSGTQVTLTWTDNATNETGFQIQRSTSSSFTSPTTFTIGTANANGYVDTTAVAGTTYYYRVLAVSGATSSAYSATASVTTPTGTVTVNAPSNLKAVANSATQVALTWADTATNETGFQVQRSTSSSFTTPTTFTINTANTQSYTDSTAVANTTYYYRVLAFSGSTDSSYSASVSVTTPGSGGATSVQSTPTGFAAVAQAGGQVKLTWADTATAETGYEIQVSTVYNFATIVQDVVVPTANLSTFTVTGLSKNTYYYFRVRAVTTPASFDSNYTGSIKLKTLTT